MKRILTIFAAILGFAGMASAQVASTDNSTTTTTTTGESCYCCPKGDFCSSQAGTCALHVNLNLVKDGEFYCPMEDNVSGTSAGSCPVSGKELKQMKGRCSGEDMDKKDKKSKKKDKDEAAGDSGEGSTGK